MSVPRVERRLTSWRSALVLLPLAALLGGCQSAPEPRDEPPPASREVVRDGFDPQNWSGSGGVSEYRNRGDALADFALTLRGTRYRYGGATREGFDCSGLVFYTHRHFGLAVPRTSRDQADRAEAVKQRKLERGDLVFFKIDSSRVNHVGIYIGEQRFVHAPGSGKPVTVNSLEEDFYAKKFSSAGRYWRRSTP